MLRQAAAPVGLIIIGAVVLILTHASTAGAAAATMLMGTACVIAISLVFLAVGRSEDAERAAAAAPPPADPHEGEAARRSRPGPPRRPL